MPELGIALAAATVIGGSTARRVLGSTRESAEVRRGLVVSTIVSTSIALAGYWISVGEKNRLPEKTMIVLLPVASAFVVLSLGLRAIARKTSALTPPAS